MRKNALFTLYGLLLLLTAPSLFAQGTLSGTVKSHSDGLPLHGVSVLIKNTTKGVLTDSLGRYEIRNVPAGQVELLFSFLGRKPEIRVVEMQSSEHKVVNVSMSIDKMELGTVEVVGIGERKSIRDAKDQGVPVTVIDGKMLAGRGTTISEVLNHQTGVKLRQTGGVGSQTKINVRGLEGNRVQIYMDGYALNTPDGNFSINDIPLQFIDRIEIYKGIVPPEFGGDGLGSAINVVTISTDKDFYDFSYKYQSYGVHDAAATLRHFFPKANIAMTLYMNGIHALNNYTIESPFIEGLKIKRDHDRLRMLDFAVGLDFLNGYFDKAEVELLGYLNNKQMQGIETNIRHTFTRGQTYGANFNFEKKSFLTKKLDMKLNAGYLFINSGLVDTCSYITDFYGNVRPNTVRGEMGAIPNLSDDYTHDARYNLNLKYNLLPEGKMSVNLNNDLRYVNMEMNDDEAGRSLGRNVSGLSSDIIGTITSLSFQNRWFGNKLTSVVTGRHYYFGMNGETVDLTYPGSGDTPVNTDRGGNYFGYSLALKYDITRQWALKGALEHNYRLPRSEELIGDRMTIMTNPLLEPEEAYNYNVGVLYDYYYHNESRLQFEANTYMMNVENMMYMISQFNYYKYQNLGKALLYGVDAEVKWDINRHWFVSCNATWQKSLDNTKYVLGTNTPSQTYRMQLPHIPILYFNWMADYRKDNLFGGKGQYTRIYYEGGYTDKYYYGYELSKHQNYKIPSACIHTLGLEYGILNRKVILGVECHNLFDTPEMTNFNYPLAGRTFTLKVRFTTLDW